MDPSASEGRAEAMTVEREQSSRVQQRDLSCVACEGPIEGCSILAKGWVAGAGIPKTRRKHNIETVMLIPLRQ